MQTKVESVKGLEHLYYKGKEIIYSDYRGMEDDEVVAVATDIVAYLLKLNRPTLQLTNIEGVFFTPKVLTALTTLAPKVEHLIVKDAVIGIKGAKRILFQTYNAIIQGNAKAFDDEEAAKDWLVEE